MLVKGERSGSRPAQAAVFLGLLVLGQFSPIWTRGLTPFWGDLTYLHLPWQQSTTQLLQAGGCRCGIRSCISACPWRPICKEPSSIRGWSHSASSALLRQRPVSMACITGWPAGWCGSGCASAPAPPAALSGADRVHAGRGASEPDAFSQPSRGPQPSAGAAAVLPQPGLLALTLAAAFLAGYPPFLIGAALLAWAVMAVLWDRCRRWAGSLGPAAVAGWRPGLLAAGLAACQLLPCAELVGFLGAAAAWDLGRLCFTAIPGVISFLDQPPVCALVLTRCSTGPGPAMPVLSALWPRLWGLWSLGRRKAVGLAVLARSGHVPDPGGSTAVSRALWQHFPRLRFRPLPWEPGLSGLAVGGAARGRGLAEASAVLAAAAVLAAWRANSSAMAWARRLWRRAGSSPDPGPLAPWLQKHSAVSAIFSRPRPWKATAASGSGIGNGASTALTNDPYRLRAAGNFGEPLVPRTILRIHGSALPAAFSRAAARLLPGRDQLLLTRDPVPATPCFVLREILWRVYRAAGKTSLAWALDERAGEPLPAGLPATSSAGFGRAPARVVAAGRPLRGVRDPGRLGVRGRAPLSRLENGAGGRRGRASRGDPARLGRFPKSPRARRALAPAVLLRSRLLVRGPALDRGLSAGVRAILV